MTPGRESGPTPSSAAAVVAPGAAVGSQALCPGLGGCAADLLGVSSWLLGQGLWASSCGGSRWSQGGEKGDTHPKLRLWSALRWLHLGVAESLSRT